MKRLFSLSILIIAALIFWGSQTWENEKTNTNLQPDDPRYVDVFINNFTITAMNSAGQTAYTLKAERFEHYNEGDYATITKPVIQLTQGDQHWEISANIGEINDNSQHITLRDNVILQQRNKALPLRLETEQLKIDVQQQMIKSTQTVRIIQRGFNLQSKGMILDNTSGQLELLSKVTGRYVQTQ